MRRVLFALIPLIIVSLSVRANDSAVRGVGGTVAMMDCQNSVRLVREKIDVTLLWKTAKVRCEFVFRNEGKAAAVKMGFPEQAGGDVSPIRKSDFLYFRSWIDGKPVKTRFLPSVEGMSSYEAWHVKDVSFSAGQTRVVVDEYESHYGDTAGFGTFFPYVLRTGKNWKGKIGQAVVTVDGSVASRYYRIDPDEDLKPVRQGNRLTYILRQFEPSSDVTVSLPRRYEFHINGTWVYNENPEIFVKQGILMAMLRELISESPAVVKPASSTRSYDIIYRHNKLRITAGSRTAVLNKKKITLPVVPYISRYGFLVVPMGSVVKALGGQVYFNKKTGRVDMMLGM